MAIAEDEITAQTTQSEENAASSRGTSDPDWLWAPTLDPASGEYSVFVTRHNSIDIEPGEYGVALTGARVILSNKFAPMPVAGHSYASAQFIGRGSTEFSFQIAELGDNRISQVQSMVEELERNARGFRKIRGSSRVTFSENPLLKLCGIQDGIVTSIDSETDERGTNLYKAQISFTSDGHHTESFHQEAYFESEIYVEVLQGLLQKINVQRLRGELFDRVRRGAIDYLRTQAIANAGFPDEAALGLAMTGRLLEDWISNQFGPDVNLTSTSGIFEAIRASGASLIDRAQATVSGQVSPLANQEELAEAYATGALRTSQPVHTPIPSDSDWAGGYSISQDLRFPWMEDFLEDLIAVLHRGNRNIPPHVFFDGPLRGRIYDYRNASVETTEEGGTQRRPEERVIREFPSLFGVDSPINNFMYGRKRQWVRDRDIINALERHANELVQVARRLVEDSTNGVGSAEFERAFPGVSERYQTSQQRTAHPTYPDLDLPPHPSTGNVIDTEPDFYFYNDGEEGLLNEIGPEVIQEMDLRIQRMESEYARLSSAQTWVETYLGRSRYGPNSLAEDDSLGSHREELSGGHEPMDAGPGGLEIDPVSHTTETAEGFPEVPPIGGGTERLEGSYVDRVIALSPAVRSSAVSEEIRQRREEMVRNSVFSIPTEGGYDPNSPLRIGPIDDVVGRGDRSHSFSRNSIREMALQSIVQNPDTTLTMRRAFPTFKIYFIEDDVGAMREHLLPSQGTGLMSGLRPIMFFDDLYNYNSVKSIRLIRSRKNPTDLLILTLTNVTGLLERRAWTPPGERDHEIYQPGFEETELENPLKKLILKEGLKVQARLGYTNDPNRMGVKFIGEVVEVSYNSEVADEITIICQSYGSELAIEKKGATVDSRPSFRDTPDLLHTMMCSPELAHFGRFELNPSFNPAEARSTATSRDEEGDMGLIRDWRTVSDQYRELLIHNRSKWILANNPADDNIYAPGVRDHLSQGERIWGDIESSLARPYDAIESYGQWLNSWPLNIASLGATWLWGGIAEWIGREVGELFGSTDLGFQPHGQTIWELLKECELKHPGWIAGIRPYGTRMTVFFGVPNQRYWADQITPQEMVILNRMRQAFERVYNVSAQGVEEQGRFHLASERLSDFVNTRFSGGLLENAYINAVDPLQGVYGLVTNWASFLGRRTVREMVANEFMADAGEQIGRTLGRFRPFRRYHLITSDHHILMNNIRASEKGTFNAVNLQYANGGMYSMKADDNIPDEKTLTETFYYPTCNNETMARRYCIGLLCRHLKDTYKGEIVVTGMDVDPWDGIYLHDERSGMYGAAEIEQVVDTFTPETGWVTEITPDMIVSANEWSTMSTKAARDVVLGQLAHRYSFNANTLGIAAALGVTAGAMLAAASPLTLAATAPIAVGAALAWMGGYNVIRWTQDRQPILVTPLILNDRPFFSGLDGFRQDGIFANLRGRLFAEVNAVEEGWRTLHLSALAGDFSNSFARGAAGQSGG